MTRESTVSNTARMPNRDAIALEDASFFYAGRDAPALDRVNLSLAEGSWNVIAGATGSGKSTLARVLAGVIPRHSSGRWEGSAAYFGIDAMPMTASELARTIGLVQQSPDDQICTTTVRSEIAFGLENLCVAPREIGRRVERAIEQFDLRDVANGRTSTLSGGQKQRLALASTVVMGPRILVLDEPLAHLDGTATDQFLKSIRELYRGGTTIVIVEHRLDEVLADADRVILVDAGRIVSDVSADDPRAIREGFQRVGLRVPDTVEIGAALDRHGRFRLSEIAASDAGEKVPRSRCRDAPEQPAIRVEDVSFRYGRDTSWVWRDVSFDVHDGECIAVVGANGCGKSTLLGVIAGILSPTCGNISFDEVAESDANCGLVLQNPDLMLFTSTVRQEIAFGPRQRGQTGTTVEERISLAADRFHLQSRLDEAPLALSRGERLRTAIAATWSMRPAVVLVDEPSSGQDPAQVENVMTSIGAADGERKMVMFSTHDLSVVLAHADRVLVLANGRLAADCTVDELFGDARLLDEAGLRLPPLVEIQQRLGLPSASVEAVIEALRS